MRLSIACLLGAAGFAWAAANDNFNEGQKVEVREGDAWSRAVVVKKEGRRYQIRYEDGTATEEWVAGDRIRPAGSSPVTPAAKPLPKADQFTVGQKVEVKWKKVWLSATIDRKQGEWLRVTYTNDRAREWVEPFRTRAAGGTEDSIGDATPNPIVTGGEGPPGVAPGPSPGVAASPAPQTGSAAAGAALQGNRNEPAQKTADWSSAKTLDVFVPSGVSKLPPDPAPAAKGATRIPLRSMGKLFFEHVESVVITRSTSPVAVVQHVNKPPGQPAEGRVQLVNLAGGTSASMFLVPGNLTVVDAAPDGRTMVLRSNDFMDKKEELQIWSVAGTQLRCVQTFSPYAEVDEFFRGVEHALFVDATHLLTVRRSGKLALWDLPSGKAIYTCKLNGSSRPALSGGGKYLAVPMGTNVMIVDALTGQGLAELPSASSHEVSLAFSPSGKQLAAWGGGNVRVWDLTTGQLYRQFNANVPGRTIAITNDGYGLLDGSILLDFEHYMALWRYEPPRGAFAIAPGGRLYCRVELPGRNGEALASADLPTPEALTAARKVSLDDVLLLKPGVKVSIAITYSATEAEKKQIIDTLTRRLTENQLVVADNQPIRFVASVTPGKSMQVEYQHLSAPFTTEKVSVTPLMAKLSVEVGGKSAWETVSTTLPPMQVQLKQGASVQQTVSEHSRPVFKHMLEGELPMYLAKPRDPAWLGNTNLMR